jgi:hypothetical protein
MRHSGSQLGLILTLIMLSVNLSLAQEQHRGPWETVLQDHPTLIDGVKTLVAALESGDLDGLSDQFRPGKLRLLAGRANAPARLYAHSQAEAMLAAYLRRRPGLELNIDIARLDTKLGLAHIGIAYRYRESSRSRPRRDRIVAVYTLAAGGAQLLELRCP